MITGFHHIALLVSSEENLEFYKKLGFVENYRKSRSLDSVVLLEGYGIQLEVFIDSRHPKSSLGLEEPLGVRHFALKVDYLENTIYELQVGNVEMKTDWHGVRYCNIADLDGNIIELHE